MLFNSFTFLIFFIFVLILSRQIPSWTYRKIFLLAVSYLFYATWNPPFVLLLWISTLADWFLAGLIGREERPLLRRFYFSLSLAVNLGFLFYFKYGQFFLDSFARLLLDAGIVFKPAKMDIILPVGISFYTFQTLSYTFDVYRRKLKPCPSLPDYALFVTFFPHLIAGPILRAGVFLPQCSTPKKASASQIGWGITLLVLGLFTKMAVADALLSEIVQRVYDVTAVPTCREAWTATLAFAMQIFCDFSGYSTCALGIALALGFNLPENFYFPFAAVGFSDFWRRWHVSLSSWLKDYLYVPMGGSRKGRARTYLNILVTMLIGGLWHGPSWMFVLWGGFHGLLLTAERFLKELGLAASIFWQNRFVRFGLGILTFFLISPSWVFFRAKEMGRALVILSAMAGAGGFLKPWKILTAGMGHYVIGITAALLLLHFILRERSFRWLYEKIPWWAQGVLMGTMMFAIFVSVATNDRAFIYFQF